MPRTTKDFSPIDFGTIETFTFDFLPTPGSQGTMLGVGETIASVVSGAFIIVALNGFDATASIRLIGTPQIESSTNTKVLQKIGNCVDGENYRVGVKVQTTAGQTLLLYCHLLCHSPS